MTQAQYNTLIRLYGLHVLLLIGPLLVSAKVHISFEEEAPMATCASRGLGSRVGRVDEHHPADLRTHLRSAAPALEGRELCARNGRWRTSRPYTNRSDPPSTATPSTFGSTPRKETYQRPPCSVSPTRMSSARWKVGSAMSSSRRMRRTRSSRHWSVDCCCTASYLSTGGGIEHSGQRLLASRRAQWATPAGKPVRGLGPVLESGVN